MNDVFKHAEDLPTYREQTADDRTHAELLKEADAFTQTLLYNTLSIQAKADEEDAIERLIEAETQEASEQARKEIARARYFLEWAEMLTESLKHEAQDTEPPPY